MMSCEKRIKLLHNLLLKCTENSRKKTQTKTRVSAALKPRFGQMAVFPGAQVFQN